jgi:hypothetical protein
MSYPERLARELAALGIAGAQRRRIIAEITDHLACDPKAKLGEPAALAREFVDELGSRQALRAAKRAFGSLAIAGLLCAGAGVAVQRAGGFAVLRGHGESALGLIGFALSILGGQVAFVAGALGCLRALRRRDVAVLPRSEALVLVRRAGVGLFGGLATLIGLGLVAIGAQGHIAPWWTTLALAFTGAGALALTTALPPVLAAHRLTPRFEGPRGDLSDDLRGLLPSSFDPGGWRFALFVAGALALVIALVGTAQGDPVDGLLRGLADATACLVGYAALGSYLGLRRGGGAERVQEH